MVHQSFTVRLGSITANTAAVVSIDDRTDLPRSALITKAVVRNDSEAKLTVQNLGAMEIDPGERPEINVDARMLVLVPDAAVNAGEVRVTVTVEDSP